MEFSSIAWIISVGVVLASGLTAWRDGNLTKRAGVDMGFVNHGGMWGDLLLLPLANAAIVPHVEAGIWLAPALVVSAIVSARVHAHWYRGPSTSHSAEHMWPSRPHGTWWQDLSWAGWAHVVYVMAQLAVLVGFLLFPMPEVVVAIVCLIFTVHVPLGLLQPRWFLTGQIASPRQQPLLIPLLATLWAVSLIKL